MKLSQVVLFVHDLATVAAFYQQTLGLAVVDGSVADGFLRLADPGGGAVLALHASRSVGAPTGPREDVPTKLCFLVDDIDAARAALASAGASPKSIQRWEGIAFCDGVDPEGNVIQVTTRR